MESQTKEQMKGHNLLHNLDSIFLDHAFRLRPVFDKVFDDISHSDLQVWCHRRGIYGLPTHETIEWLREFIGDRTAIEVGSGNGAFGRALKVPLTDSRIQEQPDVKMYYTLLGQPTVPYENDVEKLEAMEAIEKYQPQVVFGSWLTNWIDPDKPFIAGAGSMYGLKEDLILAYPTVEAYIVIGNEHTHRNKPIMKLPHDTVKAPWIRSRAMYPDGNAIFIWRREGPNYFMGRSKGKEIP